MARIRFIIFCRVYHMNIVNGKNLTFLFFFHFLVHSRCMYLWNRISYHHFSHFITVSKLSKFRSNSTACVRIMWDEACLPGTHPSLIVLALIATKPTEGNEFLSYLVVVILPSVHNISKGFALPMRLPAVSLQCTDYNIWAVSEQNVCNSNYLSWIAYNTDGWQNST